ncbi:MAG: hypothetical protein SP4CHLAM5_02680 [Chlamydiia bacterium]|nr:hypothetical protein [Chlamydiia bacterium]MCH9618142.1 hypothetical protein [Chlamydiia bacterium]MCH9624022.1 hypothetical protein [Chlamydiia bacterium]
MIPANFSTFNIPSDRSIFDVVYNPFICVKEFGFDVNTAKRVTLLFFAYIVPIKKSARTGKFPWVCVVSFGESVAWMVFNTLIRMSVVDAKKNEYQGLKYNLGCKIGALINKKNCFDEYFDLVNRLIGLKQQLSEISDFDRVDNGFFAFNKQNCKRQFELASNVLIDRDQTLTTIESEIAGLDNKMIEESRAQFDILKSDLRQYAKYSYVFSHSYSNRPAGLTDVEEWGQKIEQASVIIGYYSSNAVPLDGCHRFKASVDKLSDLLASIKETYEDASFKKSLSNAQRMIYRKKCYNICQMSCLKPIFDNDQSGAKIIHGNILRMLNGEQELVGAFTQDHYWEKIEKSYIEFERVLCDEMFALFLHQLNRGSYRGDLERCNSRIGKINIVPGVSPFIPNIFKWNKLLAQVNKEVSLLRKISEKEYEQGTVVSGLRCLMRVKALAETVDELSQLNTDEFFIRVERYKIARQRSQADRVRVQRQKALASRIQ